MYMTPDKELRKVVAVCFLMYDIISLAFKYCYTSLVGFTLEYCVRDFYLVEYSASCLQNLATSMSTASFIVSVNVVT